MRLEPGEARKSMHMIEMCFRLPRDNKIIAITVQFSKTLLYFDDYPPDSHRGFDIAASRVFVAPEGDPVATGGVLEGCWASALEWRDGRRRELTAQVRSRTIRELRCQVRYGK
jgi:hypothetical protein